MNNLHPTFAAILGGICPPAAPAPRVVFDVHELTHGRDRIGSVPVKTFDTYEDAECYAEEQFHDHRYDFQTPTEFERGRHFWDIEERKVEEGEE